MPQGVNDWLTRREAAKYARVSETTIKRAVARGELKQGGTRRRRLYRRAWLDIWLARGLLACVAAVMTMLLTLFVACLLGNEPAQDVMRQIYCPLVPPAHER